MNCFKEVEPYYFPPRLIGYQRIEDIPLATFLEKHTLGCSCEPGFWDDIPTDEHEEIACCLCGLTAKNPCSVHGPVTVRDSWVGGLFFMLSAPDVTRAPYCNDCAAKIFPYVVKLRDIAELKIYVNKLRGVINEAIRRTKDDRTTPHDAG